MEERENIFCSGIVEEWEAKEEELAVKRTSTAAVARKAKGYSHSYTLLV